MGNRVMELFRAEKVAEGLSTSTGRCDLCGQAKEVVRVIVDADTGHGIRMFECKGCGQRNWEDD
jgi:transcription elongation factor Elf1